MTTIRSSISPLHLKNLVCPSKPSSIFFNSTHTQLSIHSQIMNSTSKSECTTVYQVPGLSSDEMDRIAEQTFQRYSYSSSSMPKRSGKGIAIVWFRNDLRVLDNEALFRAWVSSEAVLPVYFVDPRLFGTTHYFGFPKTGALRAQFLIDCLADLKKNLMNRGLNLLIQHGKPEAILPSLAKAFGAHTVYAHKETCSEELKVETLVTSALHRLVLPSSTGLSTYPSSTNSTKLQLIWGSTMYHVDDLPFNSSCLPDVYTQFRKSVESKSTIRGCIKIPISFGPPPNIGDWGCVPAVDQLGLHQEKVTKGMRFTGGESAALSRVYEHFWKKDLLRIYKETRNGMLGPDYSTKFSPWLASGSLSPRFIYEEVKRYEKERQSNDSTYWVLFELIWRDYFRFLSIKYGNSLFHRDGPRKVESTWRQDQILFESWIDGHTGYPLIDANMKELSTTGFMSNRGRQIVCSFLVRDMGIDWRMGAEWFEACLLDYDPCSNYGNWTYGAGVGNDPREDRYFSIPKQMASTVTSVPTPIIPTVPVNHGEKPKKFNGANFKRWQLKMLFYLTTLNLTKFLHEEAPILNEDESDRQTVAAIDAWKHVDFLCRNYILNGLDNTLYNVYSPIKTAKKLWESLDKKYKTEDAGMKKFVVGRFLDFKMVDSKTVISQVQDLQLILHEIHAEGMSSSESFQVAAIVEKLPPSWKEFKNYLKHKRKEMKLEDLIVRLRIEEDNRGSENKAGNQFESKANIVEQGQKTNDKKRKYSGQGPSQRS